MVADGIKTYLPLSRRCAVGLVFSLFFYFLGVGVFAGERPGELKLQAQLVWGTDDSKPVDSNLRPLDPVLEKKLQKIFKWKHYYEVKRETFAVETQAARKVEMSPPCHIEVQNLGGANIEVKLYGEGKLWDKRRQTLTEGKSLVLGGNARNETAWFVVISSAGSKADPETKIAIPR